MKHKDYEVHWLVIPNDGGTEWVTYNAKRAEHLRADPNCEVQGPFVLIEGLNAIRISLIAASLTSAPNDEVAADLAIAALGLAPVPSP